MYNNKIVKELVRLCDAQECDIVKIDFNALVEGSEHPVGNVIINHRPTNENHELRLIAVEDNNNEIRYQWTGFSMIFCTEEYRVKKAFKVSKAYIIEHAKLLKFEILGDMEENEYNVSSLKYMKTANVRLKGNVVYVTVNDIISSVNLIGVTGKTQAIINLIDSMLHGTPFSIMK